MNRTIIFEKSPALDNSLIPQSIMT